MSRSCHSATSSRPAERLPRRIRASPRQALGGDRVALVRHRRRALLAGAEPLLGLAHLGALQVAQLGRDQLDRRAADGAARTGTGRGGRGAITCVRPAPARGRARAHVRLDRGVDVRVRADRTRQLADARRLAGGASRTRSRSTSKAHTASFSAERGRLGVHAVGAPDHGVSRCSSARAATHGDERGRATSGGQRPRRAAAARARCRRRRTTSARSGSSATDGPTCSASTRRRRSRRGSCARSISFARSTSMARLRADVGDGVGRHDAERRPAVEGRELHVEPAFQAALVRPDGPHLGRV